MNTLPRRICGFLAETRPEPRIAAKKRCPLWAPLFYEKDDTFRTKKHGTLDRVGKIWEGKI